MFRTYQVFFNRVLQLADALIVLVSFLLAWEIKFHSGWLKHGGHLPFTVYLTAVLLVIPVFLLTNYVAGLYRPMRAKSLTMEVLNVIKSSAAGLLIFMSGLYFVKLAEFSRDVLILFSASFVILMIVSRILLRGILRNMRSRGLNQKFIVVVGWTGAVNRFVDSLEEHPYFGYRVLGYLAVESAPQEHDKSVPCLGTIDELAKVLQEHLVDHVVLALPRSNHETIFDAMQICEQAGAQALIIPDYFDLLPARPRFENFGGMPLIDTRYVPLDDAVNAFIKRTFDVAFSVMVLVALSPVFLLISLGVKLGSRGPVFYAQERVGKNRRTFRMYKFRSMHTSSDASSDTGWTVVGDLRRTRFGTFLRKTSLDELPQFWNVLIGDMSVIGPRPERPYFVEQFQETVPLYMIKHRVRPGITGWAQVNGWRGDTSIEERIRYDIEYIETWSIWMDLKIAFRTIVYGMVNRNAY